MPGTHVMVWNRATTPFPGAQGVALFLVFHGDEAGRGLEGPGKDEQEDGFHVGAVAQAGALLQHKMWLEEG